MPKAYMWWDGDIVYIYIYMFGGFWMSATFRDFETVSNFDESEGDDVHGQVQESGQESDAEGLWTWEVVD